VRCSICEVYIGRRFSKLQTIYISVDAWDIWLHPPRCYGQSLLGGIYMILEAMELERWNLHVSVSLWHPCRMAQNSREDSQSTLAWLVEKQEETKPQLWWKSQVLTHLQSGDMSVQSWLIILKIWRTNLTMWWKYYSVAENLLFLWKRIIIFGNRDRGQKKWENRDCIFCIPRG